MIGAAFLLLLVLAALLVAGVWVFASMVLTGAFALAAFRDIPIEPVVGRILWNATTNAELIALPLFILMAEILFRTRLSAMLFAGLAPWTSRLPGRLLHVNVLGCTMFAAICGSSAATAATVGRITLSELSARGYDRRLALGSLAGAGTLGFLIPPSIIMIIYGVLAETSILKLFIAGIVPGLCLALGYMAAIALLSRGARKAPGAERYGWAERVRGLADLAPTVSLIAAVVGTLYLGIATPSESAVIGVFGALLVSALHRSLNWQNMRAAFMAAVRTSSMMGMILAAGIFLSVALGYVGLPQFLAREIASLELPPLALVGLLALLYLVLGCFLDGTSMIVMTLPITLPLVVSAGFDKIWYGIFLVVLVELAQITPPIGFNLFVIQSLTGEPVRRIAAYALPFFLVTLAFTLFITLFPQLVLFLPGLAGSR
ncbi:MAG TPA: TRAP transporter large permease subunit [Burkholderiales bacterium]|nr:TRAP transporter large permease subunit [Burkholderiales bacterium]